MCHLQDIVSCTDTLLNILWGYIILKKFQIYITIFKAKNFCIWNNYMYQIHIFDSRWILGDIFV